MECKLPQPTFDVVITYGSLINIKFSALLPLTSDIKTDIITLMGNSCSTFLSFCKNEITFEAEFHDPLELAEAIASYLRDSHTLRVNVRNFSDNNVQQRNSSNTASDVPPRAPWLFPEQ